MYNNYFYKELNIKNNLLIFFFLLKDKNIEVR